MTFIASSKPSSARRDAPSGPPLSGRGRARHAGNLSTWLRLLQPCRAFAAEALRARAAAYRRQLHVGAVDGCPEPAYNAFVNGLRDGLRRGPIPTQLWDMTFVAVQKLADNADEVLVNGGCFLPDARSLHGVCKAHMFAPMEP